MKYVEVEANLDPRRVGKVKELRPPLDRKRKTAREAGKDDERDVF